MIERERAQNPERRGGRIQIPENSHQKRKMIGKGSKGNIPFVEKVAWGQRGFQIYN